jgi:hypothetical protein
MRTLVGDAFEAWADVASSTVTYANTGQLPVDVDVTNFQAPSSRRRGSLPCGTT